MAIEIVDFTITNGWIFHSYVNISQRVDTHPPKNAIKYPLDIPYIIYYQDITYTIRFYHIYIYILPHITVRYDPYSLSKKNQGLSRRFMASQKTHEFLQDPCATRRWNAHHWPWKMLEWRCPGRRKTFGRFFGSSIPKRMKKHPWKLPKNDGLTWFNYETWWICYGKMMTWLWRMMNFHGRWRLNYEQSHMLHVCTNICTKNHPVM